MSLVIPGQRLGPVAQLTAGHGTYIHKGAVYAALVGTKTLSTGEGKSTVSVSNAKTTSSEQTPQIHSVVTGTILRITPRQAVMRIDVIGNVPCREPFQGVIRLQDVRATDIDKVRMFKCFRPGDVVRAQVISLGDARSYFLSTASNELGVILATSDYGHTMVPVSWEEMVCPVSKTVEFRKCAKPLDS